MENGQNTEKSPGDLRRLAVTQSPVKDHRLTLMWKTLMSNNNIIIMLLACFLHSVLANDLSLESERLQVSSGLLDTSQYSSWSQQCCSLNDLDWSSDFQLFQSPFRAFGDSSKCANYNWYYRHPNVPYLFKCRSSFLSFRLLWL